MLNELRGSKIEKRSDNEGNDTLGKQNYNIIIDTYIDAYLLMHKHYLLMCIFSRLRTIHIIIIIIYIKANSGPLASIQDKFKAI